MFVRCKHHHKLLWHKIKDKIWNRYKEKYRGDAAAFKNGADDTDGDAESS